MRLPLYICPGLSAEQAARDYPGYGVILNTDTPPALGTLSLTGCACCVSRNELRDTLNSLYLNWAHDRGVKGAVLVPDAGADLGDLLEFLEDDLMLRARYEVKNAV